MTKLSSNYYAKLLPYMAKICNVKQWANMTQLCKIYASYDQNIQSHVTDIAKFCNDIASYAKLCHTSQVI